MKVSFRPVADEDDQFLFGVYKSTRLEEMAVVPWNEEQKRAFLLSQFEAQKLLHPRAGCDFMG